MYKRTSADVDQETDEPDIDTFNNDESNYAEYVGLMDDVSLVRNSSICQLLHRHYFQYPPQMGLFDRTIRTSVQRGPNNHQ